MAGGGFCLDVDLCGLMKVGLFCFIYIFIFGCTGSSLQHGLFSSCKEQELLSSFGVRASDCGGFSSQSTGSRARGLR